MSSVVNGRYIKNFPLVKAIHEGYHTLLPIGRHPITFIEINMDPLLVDVNVHPSKLEVRLSKETELHELIRDAIKDVFKKQQLIPSAQIPKKTAPPLVKPEQQKLNFDNTPVPKVETETEPKQAPSFSAMKLSSVVKEAPLPPEEEKEALCETYSPKRRLWKSRCWMSRRKRLRKTSRS